MYKETDPNGKTHRKPERGITTTKPHEWVLKVYDKTFQQRQAGNLKVESNLIRVELVFLDRMLDRMYSTKKSLEDILTRKMCIRDRFRADAVVTERNTGGLATNSKERNRMEQGMKTPCFGTHLRERLFDSLCAYPGGLFMANWKKDPWPDSKPDHFFTYQSGQNSGFEGLQPPCPPGNPPPCLLYTSRCV